MAAAEFDAGLASLAVLQCQQQLGLVSGDMIKGFPGSGRGRLVTLSSPRSMSVNLHRLKQRKKAGSS
jgi:hypothetical protein